jgi:glutaminyl-tRNA synthetase
VQTRQIPRPGRVTESNAVGTDFIRKQVAADVASGRYDGRVVTRFPPEPNGYLHIGHASHIYLNYGIAREFDGRFHLRFDDTNPAKEDMEFVRSIQADIRWLGVDWGDDLYFASDYYERMYACAETLIRDGKAYVDSSSEEEVRAGRGTPTEPGTPGPYRDRPVEENLDLLRRMRAGEFPDGAHVLRARIDLGHANLLMRDPVLYRIRHVPHYRQGSAWCIYPLYDFAHPLEDAFEGITHSLCTIEFENNRELYDWVLENCGFHEPRPHQYEWGGLDIENAVLSKRLIKPLVQAGAVSGWDDPRLSTIAAYRRRGVPAEALRLLAEVVGVSRSRSVTEEDKIAFAIREVLNPVAPRVMAVLEPLRVVLTSYPEGESEMLDVPCFPRDVPREGSRPVPFSRELFIERADFEENPPAGFRRLVPGGEVRLKSAYLIRCDEVVKDEAGNVVELRCTHDPQSRGGTPREGRRVKGTIHWVSAPHALEAEVRLFERLILDAPQAPGDPGGEAPADAADEAESTIRRINPDSLRVLRARVEPSVRGDAVDTRYQFERVGYFWRDPVDGTGDRLVFNRIVDVKSTYRPEAASEPPREAVRAPEPARPAPPAPPRAAPAVSDERAAARDADPALAARFARYTGELGVAPEQADLLSATPAAGDFFEAALAVHGDAPGVAAWIVNDLRGLVSERPLEELPIGGAAVGELAKMVAEGRVSRRAAKDVLAEMAANGGDPAALVARMGLAPVADEGALAAAVDGVLRTWPDKVEAYRGGKTGLIGMFLGEVLAEHRGADPKAVRALLLSRLES